MNALEEALISILSGNIQALHTIYNELRVPVYGLSLSILRNKSWAEEVMQDTFVRVYEKASNYRPGTNPKAWVISIARNLCYDLLRDNKYRHEAHLNEDFLHFYQEETNILDRLELTKALFSLDAIEREIVVMHVVVGLKHSEISEELGLPAGTIRWKYRRALNHLFYLIRGSNHETGK